RSRRRSAACKGGWWKTSPTARERPRRWSGLLVLGVGVPWCGGVATNGRCCWRGGRSRCRSNASIGAARPAGRVFSPLDEALGLVPGSLSPRLLEAAARQGTKLHFAEAAEEIAFFWGVWVSDDTLRRQTEAAGAALVALEDEAVGRLEREFPTPPQGPAVQQVSLDGAMVHLVGGEWAEVKTAAIGTVVTTPGKNGASDAHTTDLTYCSRLAEAARFGRRFQLEVFSRGTQT